MPIHVDLFDIEQMADLVGDTDFSWRERGCSCPMSTSGSSPSAPPGGVRITGDPSNPVAAGCRSSSRGWSVRHTIRGCASRYMSPHAVVDLAVQAECLDPSENVSDKIWLGAERYPHVGAGPL